jgi:hypothetical protein
MTLTIDRALPASSTPVPNRNSGIVPPWLQYPKDDAVVLPVRVDADHFDRFGNEGVLDSIGQ